MNTEQQLEEARSIIQKQNVELRRLREEVKCHLDALKYQARHHTGTINENKEMKDLLLLAISSMNCDFTIKSFEDFGFNQFPTEKQVVARLENFMSSRSTNKREKEK